MTGRTSKETVVALVGRGIVQLGSVIVVKDATLDLSHKDLKLEESASVTARGDPVILVKKGTDYSRWNIESRARVKEI